MSALSADDLDLAGLLPLINLKTTPLLLLRQPVGKEDLAGLDTHEDSVGGNTYGTLHSAVAAVVAGSLPLERLYDWMLHSMATEMAVSEAAVSRWLASKLPSSTRSVVALVTTFVRLQATGSKLLPELTSAFVVRTRAAPRVSSRVLRLSLETFPLPLRDVCCISLHTCLCVGPDDAPWADRRSCVTCGTPVQTRPVASVSLVALRPVPACGHRTDR
jgi:hypothetical protein